MEKRQQMTAIRKEAGANNLDKGNESGSPGETGEILLMIKGAYESHVFELRVCIDVLSTRSLQCHQSPLHSC